MPLDAAAAAADPSKLDGGALYASLCAVCHGDQAQGYRADNAPSLVNRTFLESAGDDFLRGSIERGRPGTSMAAYAKEAGGPLDAAAIGKLVGWLREHGAGPRPLPAAGAGDATRGRAVYAANCQSCHGNAQTRGQAVHLANARFLELASDAFLRWAVVNGRPGTPMEPWQGRLNDRQIDDVVAFVRSQGRPAPVGTLPAPTGKEPMVLNPTGKDPNFKPRADPCPPGNTKCTPEPRYVSVDQVKEALDEGKKLVILDARPASEWMRVHITGAVSVPYHDLKRLDEIPNDGTWVIAYCACPHHLSGEVVDALRKRGYKRAMILDEGINEWQRRGYPIVAAPGVEAPPAMAPPR